ncbi:hypothetical protein Y032_0014g2286 [Ancylostoma ceylanicum]|nr:hypothetical protein Y032_0014g2286 [Ancylostoma ceylanicum]
MLAATVGFVPSPDTHRCSYCVEARSTYADCFDDVIECAYRDPSSLIFCLNVYEHADASMVHYSARCLSYEKFYVPDDSIRKIGASGMCKFADVQPCECDVCRSKTTTTTASTTENSTNHIEPQTAVNRGRAAARRSWAETQGLCMLVLVVSAQERRSAVPPLVYGCLEFSVRPLVI